MSRIKYRLHPETLKDRFRLLGRAIKCLFTGTMMVEVFVRETELSPTVTKEQEAFLEKARQELASTKKRLDEKATKLGLRGAEAMSKTRKLTAAEEAYLEKSMKEVDNLFKGFSDLGDNVYRFKKESK